MRLGFEEIIEKGDAPAAVIANASLTQYEAFDAASPWYLHTHFFDPHRRSALLKPIGKGKTSFLQLILICAASSSKRSTHCGTKMPMIELLSWLTWSSSMVQSCGTWMTP